MKTIQVTIEYENGTFACYTDEPIGGYALIAGDGDTAEAAKADFLRAVEECRADYPDDEELRDAEFVYKYDIRAFFNEFSFFNINEVARLSGINPSLLRQYACGSKNAGEKTYNRLASCIENISSKLSHAMV